MIELSQCPCCGYYTLRGRGENDVCQVCFWQDDRASEEYGQPVLDRPLGPNSEQLREARETFKRLGGYEGRARPYTHVSAAEFADTLSWLLDAKDPWVVYNALLDLKGLGPESQEVTRAYGEMQMNPNVTALIEALDTWPPPKPLGKAYDPKDSIWKLSTLADFGMRRDDSRIAAIVERVFTAQAEESGFLHGGFDHTRSWHTRPYICISHVMTYALARFGYLDDPRLQRAYDHILTWQRLDGGWHPNRLYLPGNEREGEPSCPFGTLNVLRALVANPALRDGEHATRAANNLLECWARRSEPYRPVGFGIGATWDKVQYPFVQYQLLKTADTLAQVPSVRSDLRFQQIITVIERKRDANGRWTPEGTSKPYADFDFGQKKEPSPWLTLLALRLITRGKMSYGRISLYDDAQ